MKHILTPEIDMQFKWWMAAMVIALASGCSNQHHQTQREQANKEWNGARAGVLYSLASDQYKTGNFDKSRQTVDDALVLDGQSAPLRILSAKLCIEQGQLERAQKELQIVLDNEPGNAEAEYLTGVIFQRWQQPQEAFDAYSRASEKAPAELAYILAKAEMLVQLERHDDALSLLQEKVVYFEHSAAIRDATGQLLMQNEQYASAVEMLRQASILAPDDAAIREHLALALFYAREYREAAEVIGRLIKTDPYSQRADLWTALGECQMQINLPRDARISFESASQLEPASPTIWLSLGKAALAASDLKRAELSLRKSLSLQPNSAEAQLMLGYLRLRQDKLSEALSAFQKAAGLDRGDTVSLCMIGYVLEKMGRSEQGLQYYAQALQIRPNDELATRLMANVSFDE